MTPSTSKHGQLNGGPSRRSHQLPLALALAALVWGASSGPELTLWPATSARAEAVKPRSDGTPAELIDDEQLGALRNAIEDGSAEDRFQLALELMKFKEDEKDAEAFALLGAAVEERHIRSITLLAACYGDGRGVDEDIDKAVELLKRAANLGQSEAQLMFGMMLQEGRGMEKDPAASIAWLRRSLNQGNPNAMIILSRSYAEGLGVEEDGEAAMELAVRASAGGYSRGLMQLASLHVTGVGSGQDLEQAMELLEQADENLWAKNNLAWLLATAPDPDLHDGRRAVGIMRGVLEELTSDDVWPATDTLAAAHARSGNNKAAVQTQRNAIQQFEQWRAENVAEESDDDDEWSRKRRELVNEAAERLQRRLTIYQSGKAVIEDPVTEEFEPDEIREQAAEEEPGEQPKTEQKPGETPDEEPAMEAEEREEQTPRRPSRPRRERDADEDGTPSKLRNFPRDGQSADDPEDRPRERSRILI